MVLKTSNKINDINISRSNTKFHFSQSIIKIKKMMEINQEGFNQVDMAYVFKKEVGHLVEHCDIDLSVCVT
jgi:hypothetical protein